MAKYLDTQEFIWFGNHKGYSKHGFFLDKCIEDYISHRFSIPIPKNKFLNIPDLLVSPLNFHEQDTINERGVIIESMRITHNLSKSLSGSGKYFKSLMVKKKIQ